MNRRPIAVTVLSWLLILVGIGGLVLHLSSHESIRDKILEAIVELLAIAAGAFLLRGRNWARWLALAWMGFHVAISWGALPQLLAHSVFLIAFAVILFQKDARLYFSNA